MQKPRIPLVSTKADLSRPLSFNDQPKQEARPRILIVIPDDDISIDLFFSEGCKDRMIVEALPYQSAATADGDFDFIYIRGPFVQSDFRDQKIKNSIKKILQFRGSTYAVDGIKTFSDLLLEDKWHQYELFAKLMPATKLLDNFENINMKNQLIKKRISGRSRDIHFAVSDLPESSTPQDYIIQKRLDIRIEYRAFMIGGELVLPLEIKTSKTEKTKNQVIGLEHNAPKEVNEICQQVSAKLKFDFMGLDIAKTNKGYYLLEANRSPQFINFWRLNSKNLAESLMAHLLEKKK